MHVCTRFMAREVEKFGVTPVIIPLGVDEPKGSSPRVGEGPPWRLLQVASLSRVKDQARLIDALAILAESADVYLDLVGEDTVGGALQARASALGVRDRITFHGFVPHDQIAAIRKRAHLYVQTSRHESAGVAVLEAAAEGLPVIGTPVGYVADWAPERAFAFAGKSVKSVAVAIATLLKDPDRRQRLAEAAHDFARAHDADQTAEEIVKMYDALHIFHDG